MKTEICRREFLEYVAALWLASLSLPAIKNAVPHSKTLVAGFEKIAVTTPVGGIGIAASN